MRFENSKLESKSWMHLKIDFLKIFSNSLCVTFKRICIWKQPEEQPVGMIFANKIVNSEEVLLYSVANRISLELLKTRN